MNAEPILVVGAGAIGGVIASALTRAGHRIQVMDTNAAHVAAMVNDGLTVEAFGQRTVTRIDAVTNADALDQRFAFAVVTVKAPYLEAALTPLVRRGLVDVFVSLGNGLVQDRISAMVEPGHVIVGTVEWGATNLGIGQVAQTTHGEFVLGELDGSSSQRLCRLAGVLGAVAPVRISPDIQSQIWSKLLVNSALSGLGAVGGMLYGEVAGDERGRNLIYALWREGWKVATTQGIALDRVLGIHADDLVVGPGHSATDVSRALDIAMSQAAATKASMLQDLERGVRTEVDVINGGVVTQGAACGVGTPFNSCVANIIHRCEQGIAVPARSHFADFDDLLARANAATD